MNDRPVETTVLALADRYDAFLLDAYGVLVDRDGALAGASELLAGLRERGRSVVVVTNDASRRPATAAERFSRLGLDIPVEHIVTSGSLIAGWFAREQLEGARAFVLGPEDSKAMTRDGGAQLVEAGDDELDVLVVADEAGYPFVDTLDATISALFRAVERGREVRLLLPNPDRLYPKSEGEMGIAAGSIALVIEDALSRRFPKTAPRFTRLGKPHRPIFDEARRRAGGEHPVMVGDQLATDIRGANDAGLASALVEGGVDRWREDGPLHPDYLVTSLV
jgi:HAD superfamily hydrolase (TIGR01450 family)